jgi:membrane-bound metal-dependent hydrolase YbcI (DUF457 family)
MPDWKTHLIFSLFLVIVWIGILNLFDVYLSLSSAAIMMILITFSSLFPDIDMRRSKMRDMLSLVISGVVSAVYLFLFPNSWYYAFVYFVVLYFILRYIPTKHRGITHSFKFSLPFSAALASVYFVFTPFMMEEFILWFVIVLSSYGLHLAVDKV